MDATPSSILLVYGPLGVMALVSMLLAIRLYKDRERERAAWVKERKERDDEREAERAAWQKQMETLQERHMTKAETWMQKYHEQAAASTELNKAQTAVLESLMRSREQRRG